MCEMCGKESAILVKRQSQWVCDACNGFEEDAKLCGAMNGMIVALMSGATIVVAAYFILS